MIGVGPKAANTMPMKRKPVIRYNTERRCFVKNGEDISFEEAKARWEAVDSDWSQGAFRVMTETLYVSQTPKGIHD